jgi:hypothetical protein
MQNASVDKMTIRDLFAAFALQGMCACGEVVEDKGSEIKKETAKHAYALADEMMRAAGG